MIVVLTISVASGIFEGQPFFGTMGFYLEHDIGLLLQKKHKERPWANLHISICSTRVDSLPYWMEDGGNSKEERPWPQYLCKYVYTDREI